MQVLQLIPLIGTLIETKPLVPMHPPPPPPHLVSDMEAVGPLASAGWSVMADIGHQVVDGVWVSGHHSRVSRDELCHVHVPATQHRLRLYGSGVTLT